MLSKNLLDISIFMNFKIEKSLHPEKAEIDFLVKSLNCKNPQFNSLQYFFYLLKINRVKSFVALMDL